MSPSVRSAILVAALTATAPLANAEARAPTPRSVATANAAARIQPQREAFQGAMQRFAWSEGGLYQVYTAPGRVTDLVLEPGERLAGPGPIAAGDTARWVIGDTESGEAETRRVHVLIKPTLPGLSTNLVINTDRRTYYVELRSGAATYMASVAWTYPKDALIAVSKPAPTAAPAPPAPAPPMVDINLARLNFDYRIFGDKVAWRPQQVFDDGAKVHVVLPSGVATSDLPPLFLIDAAGRAGLVNYRLDGRQIIVDRLFDRAELRLGDRRWARKVRIERIQAP